MRKTTMFGALSGAALVLAACSGPATDTQSDAAEEPAQSSSSAATTGEDELVAVTTTTPLGSVVSQIASCAGGTATTVMGPGDNPHSFEASSKQVAEMEQAPVVVISGLGLEEGLLSAIGAAEEDGANVLDVGAQIDPLTFGGQDYEGQEEEAHDEEEHDHDEEESGHTHAAEDPDPHWWLDPIRMAKAATIIGATLAESTGNDRYTECGQEMSSELTELSEEISQTLEVVPAERRKLVTDHKAFQYFGDRYDFEMIGTVIPSGSTEAEPSSEEMATLVATIKEEQVPAIFSNTTISSTLPDAVAEEVGADVQVVPLYVGSVGPEGSGAETYQGMMREDARLIADALK